MIENNMLRLLKIVILVLMVFGINGCKSSGADQSSVSDLLKGNRPLPEGYSKVFVASVEGNGIDPVIRDSVFSSIVFIINQNNQLSVAESPEKSDMILKVRITWYSSEPTRFNSLGIVEEKRIRLISMVSLIFTKTGEVRGGEKTVESEQVYSDSRPPVVSEYRAVTLLAEKLAERIISVVITGWYDESKK